MTEPGEPVALPDEAPPPEQGNEPSWPQRLKLYLFGPPDPRWEEADDWRSDRVDRSRSQASVCPRKCVTLSARREVLARSLPGGRAEVRVHFEHETDNCPKCGSTLLKKCGRCEAPLLSPVGDRCEGCGLPFPWAPERLASDGKTRPRQWKKSRTAVPAKRIYRVGKARPRLQLLMIEADITNLNVDAIVSNDDVDGRMYTQIASSIKAVAGTDAETQSRRGGPYPQGVAWLTDPGTLRLLRTIIHVSAVDRQGRTDLVMIERCLRSALDLAREEGCQSVGVAAFGTGPTGTRKNLITVENWLEAMTRAAVSYLHALSIASDSKNRESAPLSVIFTIYGRDDFDALVKSCRKVARSAAKSQQLGDAGEAR
jgi:O-acetyl-ADP-ribose deacetylase (regulator of RNase III)